MIGRSEIACVSLDRAVVPRLDAGDADAVSVVAGESEDFSGAVVKVVSADAETVSVVMITSAAPLVDIETDDVSCANPIRLPDARVTSAEHANSPRRAVMP